MNILEEFQYVNSLKDAIEYVYNISFKSFDDLDDEVKFDVCETLHFIAQDWGFYNLPTLLEKIQFKPSPVLKIESLTDNGKELYNFLNHAIGEEEYSESKWSEMCKRNSSETLYPGKDICILPS